MTSDKSNKIFKAVGIGCLAVVLLIGAALLTVYIKRDAIFKWFKVQAAEKITQRVLAELPKDLDVGQVKPYLEKLQQAVREGKLSDAQISQLARQAGEALKDEKLDKEEIEALMNTVKQMTGP
jgi:uncharacterized protein HemY